MHINFKLELDKSSALELPSFEPEEIDFWLNSAIRKFVKTRFTGTEKNLGFEEHTKRIEDLRSLVNEATISGASLIAGTRKPLSYVADISTLTGYWFSLGKEVKISYTGLGEANPSTKNKIITVRKSSESSLIKF